MEGTRLEEQRQLIFAPQPPGFHSPALECSCTTAVRRQGSAADFRFSCIRLRVRVELQGFQEMLETEDTQ